MIFRSRAYDIAFEKYANGGTAVVLIDVATLQREYVATSWIEGLLPGEVAIKDYGQNEGMYRALVDAGIIKKAHRQIASGFVVLPVCKLARADHN